MLVWTRKKDETINIDGNIQVVVLAVVGKHVRLGLTAPRNISILRGELPIRAEWSVPDEATSGESRPIELEMTRT
jgi:carbon storage regulator